MRFAARDATSMRSVDGTESLADLVANPDTMRRLHRMAESRANLPYMSEEARDIVADAIATVAGSHDGKEDPRRELRLEIRRRAARSTSKKARAERFVSLDALPEYHLATGHDSPLERLTIPPPLRDASGIVARIRALAASDVHVVQLLDALVAGERRARDPRRFGITARTYRSARERLAAYATLAAAMLDSADATGAADDGATQL
jgi:hypothetical protein